MTIGKLAGPGAVSGPAQTEVARMAEKDTTKQDKDTQDASARPVLPGGPDPDATSTLVPRRGGPPESDAAAARREQSQIPPAPATDPNTVTGFSSDNPGARTQQQVEQEQRERDRAAERARGERA